MKLKNFVKNTLVEISEGIKEAQNELDTTNSGTEINPKSLKRNNTDYSINNDGYIKIQEIDFDIAVIVNKDTEDKAGIGVLTSIINAGATTKEGNTNTETHRIKFKVPIKFS